MMDALQLIQTVVLGFVEGLTSFCRCPRPATCCWSIF